MSLQIMIKMTHQKKAPQRRKTRDCFIGFLPETDNIVILMTTSRFAQTGSHLPDDQFSKMRLPDKHPIPPTAMKK